MAAQMIGFGCPTTSDEPSEAAQLIEPLQARTCERLRMPAMTGSATHTWAGVRKRPMQEIAGGEAPVVRQTLWR